MPLNPTYSVGTVSVSAGGSIVTGVGTLWLAAGIRAGDVFECRGLTASVASVESNTSLTLARGWSGTAVSASAYELRYTADAPRVIGAAQSVIASFDAVQPVIGLLPSIITNSGYTAVLQAAAAAPVVVQTLGGVVNGRNIRWLRQSGGPCLGGGWVPDGVSRPEHFGNAGTSNDVAVLRAWVEYGGIMTAAGTYGIPGAGAASGGVIIIARRDIDFVAEPTCRFVAGINLDANMFRITPSPTMVAANGRINIKWIGGFFDQQLQCNSTSVPFPADYPVIRPGAAGTTDALYIVGDMTVGGVVVPGYERVEVAGITTYAGAHWQVAGGDSGVFIAGAVTQSVHDCRFIGARDLGYYGSGLGSGQIPESAVYHYDNVYVACCMGGIVKRQQSRVFINDNVGFNTATVVGIQGLSGTLGEAYEIAGNIGYNAHQVVRIDDSGAGSVTNNKSFNHGHILATGSVPTAIFNDRNCVVRFNNVQGAEASENSLISVDPRASVSAGDAVTVRLWGGSANNLVRTNRATAGQAVVREELGGADYTTCFDNVGTFAMTLPVEITGANSVDLDLKGILDALGVTYPSVSGGRDLKIITLPNWFLARRLDEMDVFATGTFSGTAGLKSLTLTLNGSSANFPQLPNTFEGDWAIKATIVSVSATSYRIVASLNNGQPIVLSGNGPSTRPWTIKVSARTFSAADTVTQNLMRIT